MLKTALESISEQPLISVFPNGRSRIKKVLFCHISLLKRRDRLKRVRLSIFWMLRMISMMRRMSMRTCLSE